MTNDEVIKRVDKAMSLNESFIKLRDEHAKMSIELLQLKAQLEKAESVIKFYAQTGVWGIGGQGEMVSIDPCDHVDYFSQEIGITTRGGKRAREYFANKEENENNI